MSEVKILYIIVYIVSLFQTNLEETDLEIDLHDCMID